VQEVAVDRPGERPAVAGDRGHHQQPHARQLPGQPRGGKAALAGDDAPQVLTRGRRAAVQELLQVIEFLRRLEHPPITPRGYDIRG
jgi:hypothetical protein